MAILPTDKLSDFLPLTYGLTHLLSYLLTSLLGLQDGAAKRQGVCVQQLAPDAAPREHIFQPAEEAS